jgi:hypothetical protein
MAHLADGPPTFALTKRQAAASLSMSIDSFERHVLPSIRVVRKGRLVLVPTAELARWTERNAAFTLSAA